MKKTNKICGVIAAILITTTLWAAETAASAFKKAQNYQAQENWYKAIEMYQQAVKKNKSYGEAYFGMAQCSYALEQYNLVLTYLESAGKYLKNRTDLLNLRGFALIGLGETEQAKTVFETVLASFPNDIDARFGLAELEILEGRISGAEEQYGEALQRQNQNKKALLSLALVSQQLGKPEAAREYISQALKYYSASPEVYYYAACIAVDDDDLQTAEEYIRVAIQLNPSYKEAYQLLTNVLYRLERYEEVIEICTYRTSVDRKDSVAWYVKGMVHVALGDSSEAISAFSSGLVQDPNDEVMRTALEMVILDTTDIEDNLRKNWAKYHQTKAAEYIKKFYSVQAEYEYQRSLRLNPQATDARLAYAELLLADGYAETYLQQLKFVQSLGSISVKTKDTIEAYNSLLYNTLPIKWNVDPFYLDRTRFSIGVYFQKEHTGALHPGSAGVTARLFADLFSVSSKAEVAAGGNAVESFTEAYELAREAEQDYFCILTFDENDRELTVSVDMFNGRTGNQVQSWNVYRTGNDRYSGALRKLKENLLASLPYYAKIIERTGTDILVDAGRIDGVSAGTVWAVVKAGSIRTADDVLEITYSPDSVLGTLTLTDAGEEISEGTLSVLGFYDRVNTDDLIVPLKLEEDPETESPAPAEEPAQTAPENILLTLIRSIK